MFDNMYPPVQRFTGPGGICYQPTVSGYQGYDPTLAKQLVQQSGLGKVTISLGTIQNLVAEETTEALQTQWAAVGIHTTIHDYALAPLIAQFTSGKWQSMIQTAGSYDPAAGVGVGFSAALGEAGLRMLRMGVTGDPGDVVGRLAEVAAAGADTVYFHLYDVADLDHIRLLAREVLPQLN